MNKIEIEPFLNSAIVFQVEHLTLTLHNLKLTNDLCIIK